MLEEIKKEFYEAFPQNRFVGYTSNIIWPFIEQKLIEAIKQNEGKLKINFAEKIDNHINIVKNDCMNANSSYMRGYTNGCLKIKQIINELKGE